MKKWIVLPLLSLLFGGCGGSTPPIDPPITYYSVNHTDSDDFVIYGLKDKYQKNEMVSFTITVVNEEKELTEVLVDDIAIEPSENVYSFLMPEHDTFISVSLEDKEPPIPPKVCIAYHISYEMTGKTSYQFKEGEGDLIKDTFVTEDEENIISDIESFSYIYGGGYGGSNENKWNQGDMLKFGTTSVNGGLTLSLSKAVNKVTLSGLVGNTSCKLRVGDSGSTDWTTESGDNKTELKTLSEMNIANKENVESESFTDAEFEFEATTSLKIGTINNKVFYLTNVIFYFAEQHDLDAYTVTWLNDDGSLLKTDIDVLEGTTPTYNGSTPKKESTEEYDYIFTGWNPIPAPIYSDMTYTAVFYEKKKSDLGPGYEPYISADNKTVEYGFYPQSHVKEQSIIDELENLDPVNSYGWCQYNGDFYMKATANTYNGESYAFSDGIAIVNGESYWFKCETIKWNVLSIDSDTYVLMSNILLDSGCFYSNYSNRIIDGNIIYPNNYEHSDIRNWLNNDFLNEAFAFGDSNILEATVDNSASTTDRESNQYACDNTLDKIYLPSYSELNTSSDNYALTSDYARATGVWCNTKDSKYSYNGSYWTRSPSSTFSYCSWNLNSGGVLSEYAVDGENHSIRPCVSISL